MSATLEQQVSDEVPNAEATSVEPNSATFFNSYVGFVEATRITGRNKSTISRDTKSGKLPSQVSATGQKQYKVADLEMIYGLQNPKNIGSKKVVQPKETEPETVANAVELAILKERVKAHEEMLRVKDAQIRDLQESRDKLLDQNNRLTLLLPAPAQEPVQSPPATTPQPEQKRPWWKFSL